MENTRGHTRENTEHKIIREEVLIFRQKTSYAKEVLLLYEKRHWAVLIVHVLRLLRGGIQMESGIEPNYPQFSTQGPFRCR